MAEFELLQSGLIFILGVLWLHGVPNYERMVMYKTQKFPVSSLKIKSELA